jgi:anti-sigma B factor antagonist
VVWLRGEHEITTTAALSETLARAMAGDADVVVDLSDVQFLDAATIGVLVRARNLLLPRSRSLSLRAPAEGPRRVLAVCGLARLIESGPPGSGAAGALGSWVAVPASDRAGPGPGPAECDPAVARTTAASGDSRHGDEATAAPPTGH